MIPGVNRELLVLATGAGSLILSHVNDAGFWLVKQYFNMTVAETFKDLDGDGDHLVGGGTDFHHVAVVGGVTATANTACRNWYFSQVRVFSEYEGMKPQM